MDSGALITVIIGIGAIQITAIFAIAAFIWQIRSQRGQLETQIEELDTKLSSEIREQTGELRQELREQTGEFRQELREQARELRDEIRGLDTKFSGEIKEQGNRVTEAMLEQARLDGVNSVLLYQSHTHEPYPQQPRTPEAAD